MLRSERAVVMNMWHTVRLQRDKNLGKCWTRRCGRPGTGCIFCMTGRMTCLYVCMTGRMACLYVCMTGRMACLYVCMTGRMTCLYVCLCDREDDVSVCMSV